MVGTNMIVAFGFTGVSTALTVLSDIEVLDTITWSWTSIYTPSSGYHTGNPNSGKPTGTGNTNQPSNTNGPSSPSIAIVAGAVTGGLVVLVLILVALYMINVYHRKKQRKLDKDRFSDDSSLSEISSAEQEYHTSPTLRNQSIRNHEMLEIKFKDPPSATEPFEYSSSSSSRRPSAQTAHPLQICTKYLPSRSDTIGTSTTANSSIILVPSPWTPMAAASVGAASTSPSSTRVGVSTTGSSADSCTDWMIRRAASTPTHHPMQSIASSVSKPDDKFYPQHSNLRRAATISEISNSNARTSVTGTQLAVPNSVQSSQEGLEMQQESCNNNPNNQEDDDALFDRQEFILQSEEVAKIEDEQWSLGMIVLEGQLQDSII
jgi:hypothetical protein